MDGSEIAIGDVDRINQSFHRSKHKPVLARRDAGDPVCAKQDFLAGFYLPQTPRALCCFFREKKMAIFKCRGCAPGPTCLVQGQVISGSKKGSLPSSMQHEMSGAETAESGRTGF